MSADASDPTRLARLADIVQIGGEVAFAGFLGRFRRQLEDLRATPDWSSQGAHRIVGLAGLLGFSAVEQAWSAIEDAEAPPNRAMRTAALEALDEAIAFIESYRR